MEKESNSEANKCERPRRPRSRLNSDDDVIEWISKKYYEDREAKTVRGFISRFSIESSTDGPSVEPPQPTVEDWNFEILYGQVLASLLNILEDKENLESNSLVEYLQKTCKIDVESHHRLLAAARGNQHALVLNIGVLEAKGLRGKDANGLSDPFCVLYVSSEEKQRTLVQNATLDPVWNDQFCFPIKNAEEDVLHVEVWDFDPEESFVQKLRRCRKVDSLRGFQNYIFEAARNAAMEKQTNSLLGSLNVPLKDIPAHGWEKWFDLLNKRGNKKKGEINLQIAVGLKKDKKAAIKEYRHITYLILDHELGENRGQQHPWDGKFSTCGEYILRQLRLQGGFTPLDISLAQWRVFTRFHSCHPLNAEIFIEILKSILPNLDSAEIDPHEVKMFWESCKKLVQTVSTYVEDRYQCFWNGSFDTVQMQSMIRTMKHLKDYLANVSNIPEGSEKLISVAYIANKMEIAVTNGAKKMFDSIKNDTEGCNCEATIAVKIGQKLVADLEQRFENLNTDFQGLNELQYYDMVYRVYDGKYREVIEPVAKDLDKKLESLATSRNETLADDLWSSGGLELFRAVQAFAEASNKLRDKGKLQIQGSYHGWFYSTVVYCLERAQSVAERRIQNAINLDTFTSLSDFGNGSKISSSAVDTLCIFGQIFVSWNQLAWPDVQESYAFTLKIVDDVLNLVDYYSRRVKSKIEELGREKLFHEISDEPCFAIANIEHVTQESIAIIQRQGNNFLATFPHSGTPKLCTKRFPKTLNEVCGGVSVRFAESCNKIMEHMVLRMETSVRERLMQYVKTQDERVCADLYDYLDESCQKLEKRLFEESYKKMVGMIWRAVSKALKVSVETGVHERKPPQVFQRMERIIEIVFRIIFPHEEIDGTSACGCEIQEVQNTIKLHKASTDELILMYWRERLKQQSYIKKGLAGNGNLNFRLAYYKDEELLRVGVLHCTRLKACDLNGKSDPFVRLEIIARESGPVRKVKTKAQDATLYPMFEETFSIPITPELWSSIEILRFSVKDYDRMKKNDWIGEGLLGAESIRSVSSDVQLSDLPQIDLPLSTPNAGMSKLLEVLESRWEDPKALKFARKERAKQLL